MNQIRKSLYFYLYASYWYSIYLYYSAAPESVGLLTELNDAVEQLENIVNPLLSKVREGEIAKKGENKIFGAETTSLAVLLPSYEATTFYLLKSEGQPVWDHPVIARLVDIKILLDKVKVFLFSTVSFKFEV